VGADDRDQTKHARDREDRSQLPRPQKTLPTRLVQIIGSSSLRLGGSVPTTVIPPKKTLFPLEPGRGPTTTKPAPTLCGAARTDNAPRQTPNREPSRDGQPATAPRRAATCARARERRGTPAATTRVRLAAMFAARMATCFEAHERERCLDAS
jgi:hypothetical protein